MCVNESILTWMKFNPIISFFGNFVKMCMESEATQSSYQPTFKKIQDRVSRGMVFVNCLRFEELPQTALSFQFFVPRIALLVSLPSDTLWLPIRRQSASDVARLVPKAGVSVEIPMGLVEVSVISRA